MSDTHPELFEHQRDFLDDIVGQPAPARACLYFRTGAGKTLTALLGMKTLGYDEVLVIAPPSTHDQWMVQARKLGMTTRTMSHAKFRMKDTRLAKDMPVIADESHLFGGHAGKGWKKLDTMAMYLKAPLFLLSATPQYNDAERVYCIAHVLDPHNNKGGYLAFLYEHCVTKQNPFSMQPIVEGFKNYASAEEFLAAMDKVYYLPDEAVFTIDELYHMELLPDEFMDLNYNRRKHRMMASQIEKRHAIVDHALLTPTGEVSPKVYAMIKPVLDSGKVLVFATHSTVAQALHTTMLKAGKAPLLVTGATPKQVKADAVEAFVTVPACATLIGTATLATGTDGLDKVCDTLLILDDTDDDALRRQLVGRILPRGSDTDASQKKIFRLNPIVA